MHRMKEEVILRILVKESLDLELWLKRYGILKFRGFFVDFSEARDLFGIIFQILGSGYKFMDCRLISKKSRGLSAKCPKLDFPGIVFQKENQWIESTSPCTAPAWSTVDRWPLPRSGAHRSSASSRSGARELRPRGGGEEGRVGEPNGGVAAAREAVEGHLTSDGSFGSEGRRQGRSEG
jgi:hypothetical protein